MLKSLIVVPTYNEVDNIGPLIAGIRRFAPQAHVLFVDDNSTDGTRAAIDKAATERPGTLHLLPRARKLGLGTAYVAGFKWGLTRGYDALIEMDADLSHRPEDLERLIAELASKPLVVGSRYVRGGGTENWNFFRRIISLGGSFYARSVLRLDVRDLTGGFNAWRRQVVEAINPDSIKSEGYTFQIELKFRAHLAGFPIHEMPILFVERRAGKSKMSGKIVLEAMYRIWHLALKRRAIRRDIAQRAAAGAAISARS